MKAFPIPEHTKRDFEYPNQYEGMDLRDYFAAKVLQSLITVDTGGAVELIKHLPVVAYMWADAMMKARSK